MPAHPSLKIFPAALLAHTRELAACTRSLAQQLRAVAHGTIRLGAPRIDSQVQWHVWVYFIFPQLLLLLSSIFPE